MFVTQMLNARVPEPRGAARGWHGGSTGATKCLFQEIDFRAMLVCINILNANKIEVSSIS